MRYSICPQSAPTGSASTPESSKMLTTRDQVQRVIELPEWWTGDEDWGEQEERKFIRSDN